jgi:hypothetical protein
MASYTGLQVLSSIGQTYRGRRMAVEETAEAIERAVPSRYEKLRIFN